MQKIDKTGWWAELLKCERKHEKSSLLFKHKNYLIKTYFTKSYFYYLLLSILLLFIFPLFFLVLLFSLPTPYGMHLPIQKLAPLRAIHRVLTTLKQAMNIKPLKVQTYGANKQAFSNFIALATLLPFSVCSWVCDRLSSGGDTI